MRVICLSCGHKIEVDSAYEDYEGQIKCIICGVLLEIKAQGGKLSSVNVVKAGRLPSKTGI